ncbi:MAG: toxic anion resistance protein [Clostridia bacterium]|nr:toxic anion resistance protein [Clostridia bacterium]
MENKINLTLDPFGTKVAAEAEKIAETAVATEEKIKELRSLTEANLTPEELEQVRQFAGTIDITDTTTMLQYGAGSQQKIADFSDSALAAVKTQDLGEAGDMIAKLVGELKSFNDDADVKGLRKLFTSAKKRAATLKARYSKCEVSVNDIVTSLDKHQVTLLKDVAVLDKLYEKNLENFKELSMYIIAGKEKLEAERSTTLVELTNRAKESGLAEDAQKANDYAAMCDRFEKKIYDLELTRMVSIQMAPQIRLVQNNDTQMSEKIQSTIVNTIPLWKSQMIITLGLVHSESALKAEQAVTNMTNELLKKNAKMLHQSTVEIAKESERGVIDIETLTETNKELIDTLNEVQQIQTEGKQKRLAAEAELGRIENEIKNKLLEIKEVKA